jgi:lysyl-tRNA synthetase class II
MQQLNMMTKLRKLHVSDSTLQLTCITVTPNELSSLQVKIKPKHNLFSLFLSTENLCKLYTNVNDTVDVERKRSTQHKYTQPCLQNEKYNTGDCSQQAISVNNLL